MRTLLLTLLFISPLALAWEPPEVRPQIGQVVRVEMLAWIKLGNQWTEEWLEVHTITYTGTWPAGEGAVGEKVLRWEPASLSKAGFDIMTTGTGTTPLCGYCGRPVIWGATWHGGRVYHIECAHGPGGPLKYEHPKGGIVPPLSAGLTEADVRRIVREEIAAHFGRGQ